MCAISGRPGMRSHFIWKACICSCPPAPRNDEPSITNSMDIEPLIDIRNLSHRFKEHQALDHVSFMVRRQAIHGFVGPNGAGKTTTLKILATLLRPQAFGGSSVQVFGRDIVHDRREVRRKIGFMPDHFSSYRQMTVFEYLDFFGAAYGLGLDARNKVIAD